MRFTNGLKLSILTVMIAALGFACSDNGSQTDSQLTVNGRVDGADGAQKAKVANTESTIVTAARVTSSGSFETIEGTQTETDASGNFQLHVDAEAAQHIAIVAENEGQQWRGYITSEVSNGQFVTIKPIDSESTAETKVFAEVVASGSADIVQKSDIEAIVSSNSSASIMSSSSAVSTIAAGLETAAEARVEYYNEKMDSEAQSSLEQTYDLLVDAQLQLESELESSTTVEQEEASYEVFFESTINAFMSAGLNEEQTAEVVEMWGRIYTNSVISASTEIENDARANASIIASLAIDNAVQTEAKAAGMSDSSIQAIIDAGAQLKSDIKASAGVESNIEAAFKAYHDEVRATMENDSSMSATLVVNVDTAINASGGFKSIFETSISGVFKSDVVVDIYSNFFANIKSKVESEASDMSQAKVESVSKLFILINLAS
ncbi:MAG: hypothetical protein FH748_08835 [Balneolaceae bacterium]|nr:hypothetical protein [Balneolaceae bacterium]